MYNATDVSTERNHSSFTSIASWMSACLATKYLQHQVDTPEQLLDDEAPGLAQTAIDWASNLVR